MARGALRAAARPYHRGSVVGDRNRSHSTSSLWYCPRRRAVDLAIAATANINGVSLLTHNTSDFAIISDLTDVRAPDCQS